jgi:hypothetical protein
MGKIRSFSLILQLIQIERHKYGKKEDSSQT